MQTPTRFALLLATAALFAGAAAAPAADLPVFSGVAQSFKDPDGQTDVQADELEYRFADSGADAGWTTFKGNAAIRYKGYQLRADRIRYNSRTGDAQASGNVVLTGEDGTLWKGDTLTVNLRERGGRADRIDLFSKPFRVLADNGAFAAPTKTNQIYQIDGGTITTCTNEPGRFHWQVHARRARVRPGDDVTGWGAVPRLFGVPFFYLPYYWRDLSRHYGFRFQPGFSHSWGAFLLSTYKMPILRDKQDKSFIDSYTFLDYRGERGVAFGEKLAWEFGEKESKGYVTGWYMPEDEDLPTVLPADDTERYRIRLNHYWNATDRDQVLLQALYVSDFRVQKDFFRKEYKEMTEPDNYATYTHYGDDFSAGLTARFRLNDFYGQVERLPEAWATLNALELGETWLYLENDTAAAFLRRRYAGPATRKEVESGRTEPEGYEAFRADTRFQLSYPRKYLGFLSVVPRVAYEATYYDKTLLVHETTNLVEREETDVFGRVHTNLVEKTTSVREEGDADVRSVFEVGAEVSTRAYGYWDQAGGVRWRHVVEPYTDWTYIPEPNLLPSDLWQFDAIDRIDKTDTLRIGLRQRWQRKLPASDPRELFYVDFWGDLNLDAEEEEDEETLTDVGWDARYYPLPWMKFQARGRYDFDAELLDRSEFLLSAWHDVFRCDVSYLFREDRDNLFSGYVTWYPNEHWGFDLFGRYEFEESQVEEVGGWIQHSWDCFVLRLIGSVEPAYTNEDGEEEETDWKITLTGWLTDFVPAKILEEDNR